ELHLECVGGIQRQHCDAVAARDLELVTQMRGEARNARIELRVGEASLAGEVDHRQLVRGTAAEMGDPVIVANRQGFLQRSSGLAPPDLHDLTPFHPVDEAYCDTVLRRVAASFADMAWRSRRVCARHCEEHLRRSNP